MNNEIRKREINGGAVHEMVSRGHQLFIPAMSRPKYCLAQLDNYMHLSRRQFPYRPPFELHLEARVSSREMPGTWGFGLWNDPFSLGFGAGGMKRLMPVLPNAAWFFYASEENHLALRDEQPGAGFHVKSFRSPLLPSLLSLSVIPFIPLLLWPAAARLLRRLSRVIIREESTCVDIAVDAWHTYGLVWQKNRVVYTIDGSQVFQTDISPQGLMGLVIWIDNQYFRFDPEGRIGFGFLPTQCEQFLQVRAMQLNA